MAEAATPTWPETAQFGHRCPPHGPPRSRTVGVRTPPGGIIVEAATLDAADPTPADRTTEDPPATTANGERAERSTAELRRLMDLAERYARRLVAAADPPPGVLLLAQEGDLDVVALDGPDPDVRTVPRLLATRRPSSAVLVAAAEGALGGTEVDVVFLVGETSDGQRDERRFRVRACGRTRRLTRLPDHDAREASLVVPRLFPPLAAPTA
jgi:hypothetical protein